MEAEVQTSFPEEEEVDPIHRAFVTVEKFPRRKLSSASEAQQKFKRAVLEASAELSHDFHTKYLDKIIKGNLGNVILDVQQPDTSYETLKKGFLFYLNGTGKYLTLREHLREAVMGLLHQKSLVHHVNGFKTKQEYQSFLHESYSDILDSMNAAIHSTVVQESPGDRILKCVAKDKRKDSRKVKHLRDILLFAQEALAQSDYENAHRLHTERIAGSSDSGDCWIDFAIMWLSRGDDRLAEITLREALNLNPENLVGLLLSGLIAGRHRDQLGISYLETLLKHRPLCPEIHVLLATVHSHMGNQSVAASYYENARKIHKGLMKPTLGTKSKEQKQDEDGSEKKEMQDDEAGKGKKNSKRESVKSKRESGESKRESGESAKGRKESKKAQGGKKDGAGGGDGGRKASRKSAGGKSIAAAETSSQKSEEIGIKITMEDFGATRPPALSSCLIVTWNVTKKPEEKLLPPEFGEAGDQPKPEKADGETVELEAQPNSDAVREESAELNAGSLEVSKPKNVTEGQPRHSHHHHSKNPQRFSVLEYDPTQGHVEMNEEAEFMGEDDQLPVPPRMSTGSPGVGGRKSASGRVYSQRFGSEFLWTAHLLLKLRQFEFLDLILAKEISKSPGRSTEYLYLRAVSLHLRGLDTEALEVIGEELKRNPGNCIFWVLQGHAYYNLGNKEAALRSYEQALKLPHGRESLHLAYIRFGTLCIEKGDFQLAKRVLLKRATVAPSPYLWISVGNACFALGELEDALHSFSEGNKLDNTNPVIWGHLSLVSLAQGNRNLAEQSYKWAIRFGLKKGKLLDDIKDLHRKLGYGDPGFLKMPHCLPHQVFLQRLGRETPLELYAEALKFPHLHSRPSTLENREAEDELIRKLREKDAGRILEQSKGDIAASAVKIQSHVSLSIMSLKGKKARAPKTGKKSSRRSLTAQEKQRGIVRKSQ